MNMTVHQFEMLAILKYVVKKPRILVPVLIWHAVRTQIVMRGLKCYHSSIKYQDRTVLSYGTF